MARGRRMLLPPMVVLVVGALMAAVLPTPDLLALPAYGPEISIQILDGAEPSGLIVVADDDAPESPRTGSSQRRQVSPDQLSESDRSLLDAVDDVLGADRVPRTADGRVDVPALLETVGVDAKGVRRIADGVWFTDSDHDPDSIARLPGVIAVEENYLLAPADDPLFGEQWGLSNDGQVIAQTPGVPTADIGWPAANTVSDGDGVVVAVIDSGVDLGHPDLADSIWVNRGERCDNGLDDDGNGFVDDCNGFDFVNRDGTPFDTVTSRGAPVDNNHGTHVAGIIAARAGNGEGVVGVASGAEIMSVKVFENGATSLALIIEAIDYAAANGADVINLSLGSSPGAPYSLALDEAVQRAEQHGALVVVAAGNDGVDIDRFSVWPASLANPNLITVGASTNRDEAAGFSNYGRLGVDLFAPGYEIVSTVPGGYARYHGTSMAAPMVSGIAAQVLSVSGPMEPSRLRTVILTTTAPVAAYSGRSVTGGRASAAGALGLAVLAPGSVVFTADGLGDTANQVDAVLTTGAAGAVGLGLTLELTLGVVIDGRANAVIGHELDVDVGDGPIVLETSDVGSVAIELTEAQLAALELGVLELGVRASLPDGDYLFHLGGSAASGERLRGNAVAFTIGESVPDSVDPSPDPDDPGGSSSEQGDTDGAVDSGSGNSPDVDDPGGAPPPTGSQPVDEGGSQDGWGSAPGAVGPDGDDGVTGGSTESDTGEGAPPPPGIEPPDPGDEVAPPEQDAGPVPNLSDPSEPGPGSGDIGSPDLAPPGTDDPMPTEGGANAGTVESTAKLFPTEGPDSGGTIVKVTGTPVGVSGILFGGAPAAVVLLGDGYLLVETPRHVPGLVDVVVIASEDVITISDGFRYLDDVSAGSSDGGTSPVTDDPSGEADPGPRPPTAEPGHGEPNPHDPIDPVPDGSSGETTTTTAPSTAAPTDGAITAGNPTTLANGLTVDAFTAAHPLGSGLSVEPCGADDCRAVPVP